MTLDVEIRAPQEDERMIRGLGDQAITIGRDAGCQVVLASPAVSRRHAVVQVDGAELWVENLSANGTIVDDRLVTSRLRLEHGAELRVAHYRLRFRRSATAASESAGSASAPPQGVDTSALRRRIHRLLLDRLDVSSLRPEELDDRTLRPRVAGELGRIVAELAAELPHGIDAGRLQKEIADEALGLGPLEALLADAAVGEVMVVDRETIYVERHGRIERAPAAFSSDESLRAAIERIVTPLGRRIDESQPLVDARLKDGSRVNAIIPPLAIRGACLTIRKFATTRLTMADLVAGGTLDPRMARFLERCVAGRKNLVVSGGTGSGKTTLLGVLSSAIPAGERIITVEDAAELRLDQPHVVSLETRPANMEGKGEYTIRDLVKNTLRMRPDRIVVGECRGGEALDMLQAMNTGHDGSLTTTHASSPREAVARLETLSLMAGLDLPSRAIREQIASAVHVIVQIARLGDGSRKVTHVSEVVGLDESGRVDVEDIFVFARAGTGAGGKVLGEFRATGRLPSFLGDLIARGLCGEGAYL